MSFARINIPGNGVLIRGKPLRLLALLVCFIFFSSYLNASIPALNSPVKVAASDQASIHFTFADQNFIEFVSAQKNRSKTTIIISGLKSNTTYYKFEDSHANINQFQTDSAGNYSFVQDLAKQHNVWIQPLASFTTYYIRDDSNGGACQAKSIGTWNAGTKTCTLIKDITGITIELDSNNITLDCAGHTLSSNGGGDGIFAFAQYGLTVKNCQIHDFWTGIYFSAGAYHSIVSNTVSNNTGDGIDIYGNLISGVPAVNITGNKVYSNSTGILLHNSNNNTLSDNNSFNNDGGDDYAGIFLDNSNNNIITRSYIAGNSYVGLDIRGSNNTISMNKILYNNHGLSVALSNNVFYDNDIKNSRYFGIIVFGSSNTFYHNNISTNGTQLANEGGINTWNNAQNQGNYWSDYNGSDPNHDGIGDTNLPWRGVDYYPYINENGWQGGCTSHSSYSCYNADVYWFDSCGNRQELKQDCGNSSCDAWGGNYCKSGDVYHSRTCYNKGCSGNSCYSTPRTDEQLVQSCNGNGCNNGTCIGSCTSHAYEGCYNNAIYWFDSCNQREEFRFDCYQSASYMRCYVPPDWSSPICVAFFESFLPEDGAVILDNQLFSWSNHNHKCEGLSCLLSYAYNTFTFQVSNDESFVKSKTNKVLPIIIQNTNPDDDNTAMTLLKQWKSVLALEKTDYDKILWWRVIGTAFLIPDWYTDYIDYTDVRSFTIAPPVPATPTAPSDGDLIDASTVFNWTSGTMISFSLMVSNDSGFVKSATNKIITLAKTTSTSFPISSKWKTLQALAQKDSDGILYWRINGLDKYKRAAISAVRSFRIQ